MSEQQITKGELSKQYKNICSKHERLGKNLEQALCTFLEEANIDILNIEFRVKEFDSFWEKVQRKAYKNPIKEIEDICGLRIICYYPSDLEKITEIINREFNVKESIDKADLLEPERFGYRSLHFIITLKESWLSAPNYRGLENLLAEIQVRTILMHAWAEIEHKLAYKKKEHVPDILKRKLYQLSALFELSDEQFDRLRVGKEEYLDRIVSKEVKMRGRFDITLPMNIDSLQAFLDFYFADRQGSASLTIDLYDEILPYGITIKELVESTERVKEILPALEKEFRATWAQVGVVRAILDITSDKYWKDRKINIPKFNIDLVEKWRNKLIKG
ncbi:GTP pyrophosphokinase family protein [Halobacteriota archaeon]